MRELSSFRAEQVKEFLDDLEQLYYRYNLSIAHEDNHGAFIITDFSVENVIWIKDAQTEFKS